VTASLEEIDETSIIERILKRLTQCCVGVVRQLVNSHYRVHVRTSRHIASSIQQPRRRPLGVHSTTRLAPNPVPFAMSAVASSLSLAGGALLSGARARGSAERASSARSRASRRGSLVTAAGTREGYEPRVRSASSASHATRTKNESAAVSTAALSALASAAALRPDAAAHAAVSTAAGIDPFFNFNPVCPASDGVFRVGQKAALGLAGADNIENYRPLINDVLIRVRTELCVLESFSRETALPFIREKGLGWVLPLHETSETYLAGVVFMVGANFILLGSTKVVAILAIYHDLSAGLLARAAGGLLGMATPEADAEKREREFSELMDRQTTEIKALMLDGALSREERERKTAEVNKRYGELMENAKETLDVSAAADETSALGKARLIAGTVSVPLRVYGRASGALRRGLEVFDTFCSRYFVAFTVTYVLVKTGHYVLFPNLFD